MKNKAFLTSILMVGVLLLSGCSKPGACFLVPEPSDYPSNGVEVSWSDYNTVKELNNYFDNHKMAIMDHLNDTILLTGYAYYPDYSNHEPNFEEWNLDRGFVYLVDNENHHGYKNGTVTVAWDINDSSFMSRNSLFKDNFEVFREKKWYVTARIRYFTIATCYQEYYPKYQIIDVDTVPKTIES